MRSKKQTQRSKKQTQSTNWVFTLNNYTDDEVIKIGGLIFDEKPWDHNSSKVRGVAYAHEVGEKEGTPHLQGFLQLTKKGTFLKHRCGFIITPHLCFSASALKHFLVTFLKK